jgi:2,4-dienoyl-CoA reductase-like NADH-dependent reductase (Old Yellow Enzyme family)
MFEFNARALNSNLETLVNDRTATDPDRAARILGRPLDLNGLRLRNRIVMAPMTREASPDGVPGEDVAAYYARRAAGGVGLIVTEGTYVGHDTAGTSRKVPRFHGDAALAGWRRVADAVHREGGRIVPQLWHVGVTRQAGRGPVREAPVLSPSGLDLGGEPKGRAATLAEIDAIIAAFAESAAAAERIGFDGVEIHGAHGYLVDEFLWDRTNRRDDRYGGGTAERVRFAAEIVAAVRSAVSAEFPVILRFSQWKSSHYDAKIAATPGQLEQILTPLAEAGVDAFHASTRRYWLPEFDGSDLNLAGWARKLVARAPRMLDEVGAHGGRRARGCDDSCRRARTNAL